MTNDGRTTRLSLCETENQLVLKEASLFFDDEILAFDGNLKASINALLLGQRIREFYFASL